MLFFLKEAELMIYNGTNLVSENESTRVRPSLKQKSIIDYTISSDLKVGHVDHLLFYIY